MRTVTSHRTAVITGAASGIGASFARQLAGLGYRLLLVDRCREKLEQVCEVLRSETDVEPEAHVADLTCREEVTALAERLANIDELDLLVNNAGFGSLVEFTDLDVQTHVEMLAVHCETPMRLVHAVLPGMKQRDRGAIVNVASLGAFAPCERAVQYASTKAYLVVFSQALQEELRGTQVRIQALCPGFVHTGFHATDAMKSFHDRKVPRSLWMTPDQVVACSLRSLASGRVVVIPGWRSRMVGLLMQMVLIKPLVRIATRGRRTDAAATVTAVSASTTLGVAGERVVLQEQPTPVD